MKKEKKKYIYANASFINSVMSRDPKVNIVYENAYPNLKTFFDGIRLIEAYTINLCKYKILMFTQKIYTMTKNRFLYYLLALVMASHMQAAGAPLTIRISTQWPLDNSNNHSFLHFKERLEAESKGEIHVEIYDSAKLYGDSAVAEAVSSGAVEMGYVSLPRYAAKVPAADLFQLPFLFNTKAIAAAARSPESEIRHAIDSAILDLGNARVLWWVPSGPMVLLSNEAPVADPQNLRGKTIRTYSPIMAAVMQECGGKPKDIGAEAQEKAYETHIVDIGMTGIAVVMQRRLWRFMNTVTRTNHATVEGVAVINEKFWQGLSTAHKELILAAAQAVNKEAAALLEQIEATAYRELAGKGIKIVDLSDDELLQWRICSSDVLTNFLKNPGALEQKLISAYGRIRLQPCCNQPAQALQN
jgi:C4-dicarboxylate-binding protein DctP